MKIQKLLIILFSTFILTGCSNSKVANENSLVTATFYPLANLTQQVLGDDISVGTIIPNGVEPHDYEPTPNDLIQIYQSKLFILNGAGLDPWAEKLVPELQKKGIKVINLSESVSLLPSSSTEEAQHEAAHEDEDDHEYEDQHEDNDEHEDDHEDDSDHDHGSFDPHFWLDPIIAKSLITDVAAALSKIDSDNKDMFNLNASMAIDKLSALDKAYLEGLSNCSFDTVVTSHSAFNYLAKRYKFKVVSVAGVSPEEEPSPHRLAELTNFVSDNNIKYILFETLVTPKVAETLASEAGVASLVFNPLEGLTSTEIESNSDYISVMYNNLKVLKKALNCN